MVIKLLKRPGDFADLENGTLTSNAKLIIGAHLSYSFAIGNSDQRTGMVSNSILLRFVICIVEVCNMY